MTDAATERFAASIATLLPTGGQLGLAVSGGPDSLALLVLAARHLPGRIAAATIDHRLRPTSREEAERVGALCADMGVPHAILTARWSEPPAVNLQAKARAERYALLGEWAGSTGLAAVATGHQLDDVAESLLLRLARGAGVKGLAAMRARRALAPGVLLLRPLLGWRRAELATVVEVAGLVALDDPANQDPRHDRARMRAWLGAADWADPARLAATAAYLRDADEAIEWAMTPLLADRMRDEDGRVTIDPAGLPNELQRRLLAAAFDRFAEPAPDGPGLTRALAALRERRTVTLGALKLTGGDRWRVERAPPRQPTG